jgi:DHA1 family bicyclomycin/chloramphenicol resistance-like MFS transporter
MTSESAGTPEHRGTLGVTAPTTTERQSLVQRAMVLGLLIAVGALAVDMYIPGFAAIARDLHTDPGHVQFSMTVYFLSVAGGQVVYGPLSDAHGRKPPLYLGLAIFALASIWAASAHAIGTLIAARFCQGLGSAATAVIPLAAISDEHSGPDAARLMTLAMLSLSVSPILAPSLGGVLVQFASWRLIFLVLAVVAVLAMVMTARLLPETLPPSRRRSTGPARMVVTYAGLIADRRFLLPLLIAAFGQSVLLLFISGSPFVFVTLHGIKPAVYGVIFAFHAVALIGISQFNAYFMRVFGVRILLGAACCGLAASAGLLAILVLAGVAPLWLFVALTITIFACLGLILPTAFLQAMEPFSLMAGAAAAIGVALELCVSSSATAVLAATPGASARPMVLLMAAASGCTLAAFAGYKAQARNWGK